jgi:small neutral amino acid transporter SnatA (MarC family)
MLGPAEIFTLFFVTLGPLKVLGPFVQRTRGLDDAVVREIAVRAFVIATIAAVVGSLLGRVLLGKWGVSIPAMTLTGGIVFFLVALRQLLEQYEPPQAATAEALPASPIAAASRFVFPTVLTPYGIAAVIALLAASDRTERTAVILGLLVLVMVFDLLAMLFARRILVGFTMIVLQLLGAVLAVLQVGLSVQLILAGLRSLGVIAG